MSSLCYDIFGSMSSQEGLKQDKTAFDTFFTSFEERAKKCMGRLIAMSKKLNGEGVVNADIKVLKIKILENPGSTIQVVSENITNHIVFNDSVCKYVGIHVNQATAKRQCDAHIAALKSLMASKSEITKKITEALQTKNKEDDAAVQTILENFKQVSKHLFISADRLTGSIRLEHK